jgi:hypothetical protein
LAGLRLRWRSSAAALNAEDLLERKKSTDLKVGHYKKDAFEAVRQIQMKEATA